MNKLDSDALSAYNEYPTAPYHEEQITKALWTGECGVQPAQVGC